MSTDLNQAAPQTDTDVEADLDVTTEADTGPVADVDVVLNDLEQMANDFSDHIQKIRLMQENGFFKYASKPTRNAMLTGILERADALEETAKVAFRSLKKVKRVRVPDEVVDTLLVSSVLPGRL